MNSRFFPTLKELCFNQLIKTYGIEEVARVIEEDEAAKTGAPVKATVPDISIARPLLDKLQQELLNPLLLAVVQGNIRQAEALIKQTPYLSLLKGTTIDYSMKTIKDLTPFQAALCAWDDEMCDMLAKYMTPEKATRQYQEIFPEGHQPYVEAQTPFDFSTVITAIVQSTDDEIDAALNKEQNDSALGNALNQFRIDFTLRSQQEKVFNLKHLLKAYECYDQRFRHWEFNQLNLFWRQVIGFVQRFLPANIAQDFAQGLYYRVEKKEKSQRHFRFRFTDNVMFPLTPNPLSGLGFDFALGRGFSAQTLCTVSAMIGLASFYKPYVEQKKRGWKVCTPLYHNHDAIRFI